MNIYSRDVMIRHHNMQFERLERRPSEHAINLPGPAGVIGNRNPLENNQPKP